MNILKHAQSFKSHECSYSLGFQFVPAGFWSPGGFAAFQESGAPRGKLGIILSFQVCLVILVYTAMTFIS